MKDLLIIQNIDREGPGLLRQILDEEKVSFDLVDLDRRQIPKLDNYKALVVLGGPDSANDKTPKIEGELDVVRSALRKDLPYLGICLGLQILVKAGGGKVVQNKVKELGFIDPDGDQYTIQVTEEGRQDPLLTGLDENLEVFQLHGETVETTPDMAVLATGKFCKNQIVRVGQKAYGIQSHFELTPEMLEVWAEKDPDLIPIGKEKLLANFKAIEQSYVKTSQTLLRNFLKITL